MADATPMLTVAPSGGRKFPHLRLLEGSANALGNHRGVGGAARHDGGELFAAETADHIGRAHAGACGVVQQVESLVADGVAESVVDRLEVVEIEQQHADRLRLPFAPCDHQ
jgi:hypothetical protein